MARESFDVIIAGGGPAGSALAIRLASNGRSVLVAEQKCFPREKLCGEFISPECLAHFEELGILPEIAAVGRRISETIFFARSGRSISIESEWFGTAGSIALGLSRAEMDARLLNRAREAGATVCEETAVVGLLETNNTVSGVCLRDSRGVETEVVAKLVVDATGRASFLARRIKGKRIEKNRASHVAFKTHLRGASIADGACEIYSYRGGYGGCNAVEGGLHNLCFIAAADDAKRFASDPERVMREVVFSNLRARAAMENTEVAKPWLAVPIERFGRGTLIPRAGLLTVGDSAAFIDPFTGSGILLALQGAELLSSAIIERWETGIETIADEYQRRYSAAIDGRLSWSSMLRYAAFSPMVAELTIAGLGVSQRLRRRIAQLTRFSTGDI